MADCTSNLSILLDAPLKAIVERGHGAHVRPGDVDWAYTNIVSTKDVRGYFLESYQTRANWPTTTTVSTPYERHRLSAFSGTANWEEGEAYVAGNWWLVSKSDTPGGVTTAGTGWTGGSAGLLQANAHIVVEAWLYGNHGTPAAILQLDWGTKWRLILYGNGIAIVSELVGAAYEQRASGTLIAAGHATNRHVRFQIDPLFRRCVYVFSGANQLVWEDLSLDPLVDAVDPDADAPLVPSGTLTITPYMRAWIQVTEEAFETSGTMQGQATLPKAPGIGADVSFLNTAGDTLAWQDAPADTTVTIEAKDGAGTTWAADGSSTTLPLRVTLATTDPYRTPSYYALGYRFDVVTGDRVVTETDFIAVTMSDTSMETNEERTTLSLTVKDNAQLKGKLNRAIVVKAGDDEVFRGFASSPKHDPGNPYVPVSFVCEDEWKRLDGVLLPGTESFDGMLLTDAVTAVLAYCGYTAERLDIGASEFRLPKKAANFAVGGGVAGTSTVDNNPLNQPTKGTRAGDLLRNWRDSYSSDWFMGFSPSGGTFKFVFKVREDIAATSEVTFYATNAEATAAGKDWRYVARKWNEEVIEPEANDYLVIGQATGGNPISATFTDAASADPTLEEDDRPANWIGEPRQYLLIDASLNTQEMVDRALGIVVKRGSKALRRGTFEAEWHPQLRRESLITYNAETYRVKSMRVKFEREADWGGHWRPCDYQVERDL